jgi:hypothetical protein
MEGWRRVLNSRNVLFFSGHTTMVTAQDSFIKAMIESGGVKEPLYPFLFFPFFSGLDMFGGQNQIFLVLSLLVYKIGSFSWLLQRINLMRVCAVHSARCQGRQSNSPWMRMVVVVVVTVMTMRMAVLVMVG